MKRSQLKTKLTRQVIPNFFNGYVCKLLFFKFPAAKRVPGFRTKIFL